MMRGCIGDIISYDTISVVRGPRPLVFTVIMGNIDELHSRLRLWEITHVCTGFMLRAFSFGTSCWIENPKERFSFVCFFFVDGWPESAGGGNENVKRFFFM